MQSTTLQTFNLRGMDERWIVDPQDAFLIEDMFWTSNDSWKTSGGFTRLIEPNTFSFYDEKQGGETLVFDNTYSKITSLHWFAQHNGARQWLIYEEENYTVDDVGEAVPSGSVTLKVFDGSKYIVSSYTDNSLDDFLLRLSTYRSEDDEKPFKVLREYTKSATEISSTEPAIRQINERNGTRLSTRTQSQSYGGRL